LPAGITIRSVPGAAFAARTASRSEQSALQAESFVSPVLVTLKVAAAAGEPGARCAGDQ